MNFETKQIMEGGIIFKPGIQQKFSFEVTDPDFNEARIKFASDPTSQGLSTNLTVTVKDAAGLTVKTETVNMNESSHRDVEVPVSVGHYVFTVDSSYPYGCAVGMAYSEPKEEPPKNESSRG